jgi:hypothetical protein
VKSWESGEQRRFAAFYYQHLSDFQKLSDDYAALALTAKRVFRLLDTLRSMQGDPKLAEVQQELINGFVAGVARLEKAICDLASRALLRCALTEKMRREALEAMGFVVNVVPNRTFDRILLLYIILALVYIAGLCLAKRPWCVLSGAIIATTYVGAVLSALYLKRFPFARPNEAGRPIRGYVLSALMAFGCALVVSFGLGILAQWNIKQTVQLLSERWWPWSLMAAFTGGQLPTTSTTTNGQGDDGLRRSCRLLSARSGR